LLLLRQTSRRPAPPTVASFTGENLTERFISAIPELTQELNLELATATFNETFTKQSELTTCWGLLDLGTSIVQVQVRQRHLSFPASDNYNSPRCLTPDVTKV